MLVGRGMWSPGNVGRQIHVGPIYGDSYAVRHQMLVGQESPALIEAMRRGRGRFLSGFGALSLQNLDDFKVVGHWQMGAYGPVPIPLEGALLKRISQAGPPVTGELYASEWVRDQCERGLRIWGDVQADQPTGNHLVATADPQVISVLTQVPVFFGAGVPVPMLEIDCTNWRPPGPTPTPQPKPSWWPEAYPYPGYIPQAEWPGDPRAGGGGGGPPIDPSTAEPGGAQAAPTATWKRMALAGAIGVSVAAVVYFAALRHWRPRAHAA